MKARAKWISGITVASLAVSVVVSLGVAAEDGRAQHVRWDIMNSSLTVPPIFTPGGVAFASARSGGAPSGLKIKLTGSGTFVAPASGGESSAVTGGGTWETFSDCPSACLSTGSGTYFVTKLASWEFVNLWTPPPVVIDNVAPGFPGASGNAVLRIQYSDGSAGTLGIGCHGPGAPDGIHEGVIATKNYVTYWESEAPVATVNADRTAFHIIHSE
jgi:hypothetical protein